jgi:hypothetical protein
MNQVANNFFKGMGDINLFPFLPYSDKPPSISTSPWEGVAASFAKTGANMKAAMEYFNARSNTAPSK